MTLSHFYKILPYIIKLAHRICHVRKTMCVVVKWLSTLMRCHKWLPLVGNTFSCVLQVVLFNDHSVVVDWSCAPGWTSVTVVEKCAGTMSFCRMHSLTCVVCCAMCKFMNYSSGAQNCVFIINNTNKCWTGDAAILHVILLVSVMHWKQILII